jgi:hypothetical protein
MDYFKKFKSRFIGILQWDEWDALLQTLGENPDNWYWYDTLKNPPTTVLNRDEFSEKITQIKSIISELHQEKYCGIAYADDLKNPTFVKIFHPKNLGKSCGSSEFPPLPQWLISKEKPLDIVSKFGEKEKSGGFISRFLKF